MNKYIGLALTFLFLISLGADARTIDHGIRDSLTPRRGPARNAALKVVPKGRGLASQPDALRNTQPVNPLLQNTKLPVPEVACEPEPSTATNQHGKQCTSRMLSF